MTISGDAVLENVRRYRTIASLYRQTAAFRPLQRCSLLGQAEEWEYLAVNELEAYFRLRDVPPGGWLPPVTQQAAIKREKHAAAQMRVI